MNNVLNLKQLELKEYTVSEISNHIKHLVEGEFGYVRIKGEISGLKIASSGHGYFNLKDENAIIASTCWRHVIAKMQAKLDEGLEVIATGKMTTYAGQSRYQLSVEHIEPAGAGALMQILAARKAKLQSEGLFDNSKKKPIPFFPKKIGVITSITGAVIKDIIHRISDRCPLHVLIWPVTVQGENAADEISKAIIGFNAAKEDLKPDVIIVARGGGSIEDLWCFNEEIVVRTVASSIIPIISAVGHETDFTLTDFAADLRAPTPTAAAEFATPLLNDLKYNINLFLDRIIKSLENKIKHLKDVISAYEKVLSNPKSLILQKEQKLDDLSFLLSKSLPKLLNLKTIELRQYRLEFLNPIKLLPIKYNNLTIAKGNLNKAGISLVDKIDAKVTLYGMLLASLDYKNVIARGFSVVKAKSGKTISSINDLNIGDDMILEMKDGNIESKVLNKNGLN